MLNNSSVYPTIPVTDLQRAIEFYEKVLGLSHQGTSPEGVIFEAGNGTKVYVYQREASKADHTLASFQVENLEQTISDLSQRGVKFEHYDLPNFKTDEKGIATIGNMKAAWFKDPDGNILAVGHSSK